ncbi:MAG: 50S ribosomal protein L7/L12 [Candidatus Zixiibacteriota bacterium]
MTPGSEKTTKKSTSRKSEASSRQEKAVETKSNIDQVIEIIEKMSVLELSELSKNLQDKFGVSAAVPVASVQAPAGVAETAPAEEQTEFSAILSAVGEKKIQVIKVVRELTGLGLKEAKDLVDGAPKPVKEGVPREEAENVKAKLTEVGATVEIK